jgi:hypothetical protein
MGCMTCTNTFCLFLVLFFRLQFCLAVVFYSTYLTYYPQKLENKLGSISRHIYIHGNEF